MKRVLCTVLLAGLVMLGLVGCTAGLVITIIPDPLEFYSGDDLVIGDIKVAVTGMGSLEISGMVLELTMSKEGQETVELLKIDTADSNISDQFPISIPFAVSGYDYTFKIQDFLGYDTTVNDLIQRFPEGVGIISYEDLAGATYRLKVTIIGSMTSYNSVGVSFH